MAKFFFNNRSYNCRLLIAFIATNNIFLFGVDSFSYSQESTPTAILTPVINSLDKENQELLLKEKALLKEVQNSIPTPTPSATPTATQAAPTCQDLLKASTDTVTRLRKELDDTRNRLAVSETEVERLAYLIDDKSKVNIQQRKRAAISNQQEKRDQIDIQSKVDSDMQIATVIAEKAQLRTGPGMNNSPLMTVAKGTRLAIETKSGEWYRVVAPTGARAWVSSDVLDLGVGFRRLPPGEHKISNPNSEEANQMEAAAFEAIVKGVPKTPVP